MKLEHLLAGFGVLGALICSPGCSAVNASASEKAAPALETADSEEEISDDACDGKESKNAKYTGVSLTVGLNFLSRATNVYVSDDYISGSEGDLKGKDLKADRFLNKKFNNIGLSFGLNYDFVWTNGLLMGVGVFADCMLGGREKKDTYTRKVADSGALSDVSDYTYEAKVKAGRFTPGIALRLGTHFNIVDACVYATAGVYFPNDKTYLSYVSSNAENRTLEDCHYKHKSSAFFYGIGLKKLLPNKFFGHSMGMVAEVKRLCGKSGKKSFAYKQNVIDQEIKTTSWTSGATWLVNVSAVINF